MATVEREQESVLLPDNPSRTLDKLLRRAEDLDERCRLLEWQINFRSMGAVTLFAGVGLLLAILWPLANTAPVGLSEGLKVASVVVGIYGGVMAYLLFFRALALLSDNLRRERRARDEIVDLLREVEIALAKRDNLSALERAEYRIRLARFDIGPDRYR